MLFGTSFWALQNSLLGKEKKNKLFLCFSLAYSYLCTRKTNYSIK